MERFFRGGGALFDIDGRHMAGVSYTGWSQRANSLPVDHASFLALFNPRYPGRFNPAMKAFLDAYARAVRETRRQDRFPNLAEIKSHLPDYEIYNLKKRFMRETRFFEEVSAKPSGVILVPRAREFRDEAGAFTPLSFDFEAGTVRLPQVADPAVIQKELLLARYRERIAQELQSGWEEWSRTPWRRVFALERPILYLLLLAMVGVNVFLVSILGRLISKNGF